MANETNKKTVEEVVETSTTIEADGAVKDLMELVESLPRTDHRTLPAVGVTILDEDTAIRMRAIAAINSATDPDEKVDETGRTLQQVRNEFEFGVSDLNEEGPKHTFEVSKSEDGTGEVKVIAPEINGEQAEPVIIAATPANIAPVDVDAPKNPVEAKEAGEESPSDPILPVTPKAAPNAPSTVGEGSVVKGTSTTSSSVSPVSPATSINTGNGGGTDGNA